VVALGFKRRLTAPKPQPKEPATVRHMSSVTDEDHENAIKIHKIALKRATTVRSPALARCPLFVYNYLLTINLFHRDQPRGYCPLLHRRLWLSPQRQYLHIQHRKFEVRSQVSSAPKSVTRNGLLTFVPIL